MNYNAGAGERSSYESPLFESRYQVVVAAALKAVRGGPVLMRPRERIRGWAWKEYKPPSLGGSAGGSAGADVT